MYIPKDNEDLVRLIRPVPDFPKPGVSFKDFSPLLADAVAFKSCIDRLVENYKNSEFDIIMGLEARGFLFGPALAYACNKPFAMIRKAGKLPGKTHRIEYALEYGVATLELQCEAVEAGMKVLLIDDVLATGGTINAAAKLLRQNGAVVEQAGFIIALGYLTGEAQLRSANIEPFSLIQFN